MSIFTQTVTRLRTRTWSRFASVAIAVTAVSLASSANAQNTGEDPHPEVPGGPDFKSGVAKQAGTGGDIAYAEAGVLELGGSGSFTIDDEVMILGLAPSVGWFVIDNFQLSLITQLTYFEPDGGDSLWTFGIFAEPSLHLPITNRVLVFGGVGLGAVVNDDDVGFGVRPRIGFDILVGRSGIFRPAFDLTWSSSDVVNQSGTTLVAVQTSYGISFGYLVMF